MEEINEPIDTYKKGRGAQFNTKNKFLKNENTREHVEGIDEWIESFWMPSPAAHLYP